MEKSRNSSWNTNHMLPIGWQDQPRIFVHTATYYSCEVYDAASSHLLANATTATAPSFLRQGNLALRFRCSLTCQLIYSSFLCGSRLSDSRSLHFFATNLPPETNVRLKVFAKNSKGRSDHVWLRGQTLRAPDHLVENQDFLGTTSDLPDYSRFYAIFRSPLSLTFLALTTVITMTVMTLAIIVLVKARRRGSLASSSCHFDNAAPGDLLSRDSCDQLRDGAEDKRAGGSFVHPDLHLEDKKCTCDDEFCDEQLLSAGQQFTNPYQGRDYGMGWEGPPDIILYFPYNSPDPTSADPTSSYALNEGLAVDKNYGSPFGMYFPGMRFFSSGLMDCLFRSVLRAVTAAPSESLTRVSISNEIAPSNSPDHVNKRWKNHAPATWSEGRVAFVEASTSESIV